MIDPEDIAARNAAPEDEPFLRRLFYIVREPEFAPAQLPAAQLESFLAQQYHAMRTYYEQAFPDTVYSILEDRGVSVGYEALLTTEVLHLLDFALLPEYRNHGIGSYRMRRLQEAAAEAGKSVILSVEVFNPAKRLYNRLGFVAEEEEGIYQRMRWTPAT